MELEEEGREEAYEAITPAVEQWPATVGCTPPPAQGGGFLFV